MAEAIKLKRGLIIEVNLAPTKGSETGKIRPCVVVTNNTYNERVPVIQVVPITAWSEKKPRLKVMWRLNHLKEMD
jgi:mRNA interferase MazF